eukprot:5061014-Amphidinium_carterae.1
MELASSGSGVEVDVQPRIAASTPGLAGLAEEPVSARGRPPQPTYARPNKCPLDAAGWPCTEEIPFQGTLVGLTTP